MGIFSFLKRSRRPAAQTQDSYLPIRRWHSGNMRRISRVPVPVQRGPKSTPLPPAPEPFLFPEALTQPAAYTPPPLPEALMQPVQSTATPSTASPLTQEAMADSGEPELEVAEDVDLRDLFGDDMAGPSQQTQVTVSEEDRFKDYVPDPGLTDEEFMELFAGIKTTPKPKRKPLSEYSAADQERIKMGCPPAEHFKPRRAKRSVPQRTVAQQLLDYHVRELSAEPAREAAPAPRGSGGWLDRMKLYVRSLWAS